ncbi:glycoside hydrolase family 97 protein [Solitalea sp. MAHUQ-68]|uniref:Glycoside hydrolase family 97 protein n=1 Tax=Solitalea agri TaxID=2953739 RepID=A0A9X2F1G2_9SPHI|nr:glycoside hydrolase family 97 protein [Solitalea agri]MCO4292340.1 glycoside hydrolase family 97 protein [Solitalea agri]
MTRKILLFNILLMVGYTSKAQEYTITSPNQKLKLIINTNKHLSYKVEFNNQTVIQPSEISLQLANGRVLGDSPKLVKKDQHKVNSEIKPLFGYNSSYTNSYNELLLHFKGEYTLAIRAYNEGVAYQFITSFKQPIIINKEQFELNVNGDYPFTALGRKDKWHGYETNYTTQNISAIDSLYACLPSVINSGNNVKIVVSEANLYHYPGMYLLKNKEKQHSLIGEFPNYPLDVQPGGYSMFNLNVVKSADYIAKTEGANKFPWRIITITDDEKSLLNNPIVYLLAEEPKADYSWVKPGKVAWDWWNANTLQGVDFQSGVNTETYKYFIDFAARNGIEYVNLDEGWSDQFDLLKLSDKINMIEIVDYAKQKNVKLILWMVWHTLDKQLSEALDQFQKWDIAGIKVDFMDRDDQPVMEFYERIASEAAKRKLLVNFHGACKPTGLERKYPNVINYEAVYGLEQNKWETLKPGHDTHLPFLRNFAGPMDYTPGATRNASISNFRPVFERPMSMGTRCHELAKFVCFYAPLQMLADSPTDYEKEPDMLDFLSKVPVVWDETVPLNGKLGEYLVIARRKGDTWYLAAMTDEKERDLTLPTSFLKDKQYSATYFEDGINADRIGTDYKKKTAILKANELQNLFVKMKPGGGFVAIFKTEN